MMKRRIGLSQRVFVTPDTGEKRDCLARDWVAFLDAVALHWIALPNQPVLAVELSREFDLCGIVLTGGDDIGVFPERDATEAALIGWCLEESRPLLGVCRGLQFIHHYFGGELIRVSSEIHVARRHAIFLEDGGMREVNSYHNFSPDFSGLPSAYPMTEWARSDDGAVEAVRSDRGILGLMWHPEREREPAAFDIDLFRHHFK